MFTQDLEEKNIRSMKQVHDLTVRCILIRSKNKGGRSALTETSEEGGETWSQLHCNLYREKVSQ